MVLWACILNDKYWSLYLGRPTAIKTSDIAPSCLSREFSPSICTPTGHLKPPATRVYEALLRLMELVGPLSDFDIKRPARTTEAYFKTAAIGQELSNWYETLPADLLYNSENIDAMPPPFFLLQ